jgi:hypothetical protein
LQVSKNSLKYAANINLSFPELDAYEDVPQRHWTLLAEWKSLLLYSTKSLPAKM